MLSASDQRPRSAPLLLLAAGALSATGVSPALATCDVPAPPPAGATVTCTGATPTGYFSSNPGVTIINDTGAVMTNPGASVINMGDVQTVLNRGLISTG